MAKWCTRGCPVVAHVLHSLDRCHTKYLASVTAFTCVQVASQASTTSCGRGPFSLKYPVRPDTLATPNYSPLYKRFFELRQATWANDYSLIAGNERAVMLKPAVRNVNELQFVLLRDGLKSAQGVVRLPETCGVQRCEMPVWVEVATRCGDRVRRK